MKLEPNMYVKTNDGYINKIKKVNQYNVLVDARDLFGEELNIPNNEIIKASHNIIEILEEKDLVEIEYYSPRYEERITRLFEVDFKHKDNITFGNTHCQLNIFNGEWGNHDQLLEPVIKSIVTKECLESLQYKVGE